MSDSAHIDSFARDNLPPKEQWPTFLLDRPEFHYPDRLNCAAELLDRMVEAGHGDRLCFLGANGQRWTYRDVLEDVYKRQAYPGVAAYVAAKHGAVGLVRAAALETAGSGITVNAVCPGYTETELAAQAVEALSAKGVSAEEARAKLARTNPMRRLIAPEEVADAVDWLTGPGATAITGQAIAVAGGEVMR